MVVFAAVVLYVLLTGGRPGAVRAAVMCGVLCGGVFFARPVAVVNSLALAALVILVASPAQLFDAGFQLSFAAAIGIVVFFPAIHRSLLRLLLRREEILRLTTSGRARIVLARWLTALTAVGAAAWLTVAPILAYYFHLVTPYAVLLSIIFFPVVGATVVLGRG